MYDLILSGGLVYDGQNTPPKNQDIGIIKDKIAALGNLSKKSCHKRIKLKELVITPGFIDIHSHSDTYYFLDPYAECKIRQGVTTEVIGNCGGSAAPLYGEFRKHREKEWNPLGIKTSWSSFKEYITLLKNNGTSVNVAPLVGHGNIRGAIKGYSPTRATNNELKQMQNLLNRCIEEGAIGISTGLIYAPGMYADKSELIELVKIVKDAGGIYTTHMRNESDNVIQAVSEAITVAEKTGVKLQISHLKATGKKNWNKINEVFHIIEEGINKGIDISCDRYPYIAGNTDLDVILPNWFHGLKENEKTIWLTKKQDILAKELTNTLPSNWACEVMIGRVKQGKDKWAEGLFMNKISEKVHLPPEKACLELLKKSNLQVQAMFFGMSEHNLVRILKKPYVMIGSDSSLRLNKGVLKMGYPHPRVFGTFPRVLSNYTGRGRLSFKEAVYKMTGLPATKLGLENRGIIAPGAYADITVLNRQKIKDKSTYEKPFEYPQGIKLVMVNGEIVYNNGSCTKKLSGKVLLR